MIPAPAVYAAFQLSEGTAVRSRIYDHKSQKFDKRLKISTSFLWINN